MQPVARLGDKHDCPQHGPNAIIAGGQGLVDGRPVARLGDACAYYTVEKGLAGGAPGTPPAFVAMCALICDSAEGFQTAMQAHGAEILGDIANYTDIAPVLQVSEVVVERSDR